MQVMRPGDPSKLDLAPVHERQAGPGGEQPRDIRDQDLVRTCEGHDPGRLVDGHTAGIIADDLDLAGMDAALMASSMS